MSLVLIDNNDPWLAEYNTCEKLYQSIVETLQLRNNQPKNSDEYSRISARIRVQLKQYSTEVNQLKAQLQIVASSNTLTKSEIERRQRLLEQLQSSNVKITNMYNNRANYTAQRNELLADAGTTGWGDDASDEESPLLGGNIADVREQQQMMIQGAMDYEDLENFTLMTMLDDDDEVHDIQLDSKFNLLNKKTLQADNLPMEEDENQGFSVFCEQTVQTCADMIGLSLEKFSDKELMYIADDISHLILNVIINCKMYLTMTKQPKLTCKILKAVLLNNYGYRCYGYEADQLYETENEMSIQKQCEKQFVQVGNTSKVKRLFINNEVTYNCMDVEIISYNNAPFYITQMWLFPGEDYLKNPYAHLDKQYYHSILDIVLSPVNIPFIKLVDDFDINRIALKLVNCIHIVVKEYVNNEVILSRLFDFLIALANSKYLISPAYTYVCLNLLRLAVAISTKEFVAKDQPLPLSYSIRRKAASLVTDMVRHWDIGPNFIMDVTHRVNKSSPEYKELLSHSGSVSILAALGRDIFKYSMFFHIAELFFHIKKLHTSRMQGAQKDRRLIQRFYQDVCYVRDALFHAIYQLYRNNFLDTTSRLHRQSCLDGDLRAAGYFGDLALLIRHDNHNSPFKSNALKLFDPELVINIDAFDEEGNRIKTGRKVKVSKRDKDTEDLNSLLHIGVTPVPRTKNYNCFDNEIIGPILNQCSEFLHLNYKDRQLFVDDIYYRCMHSLLQAQQTTVENDFKLTLSNLRSSLHTFYPSHFVKTYSKVDVYSEFEDYKPLQKCPRVKFNIANCTRKPEYKLKRSVSYCRNDNAYNQDDSTRLRIQYRHQIFYRRKNIRDLNFDYKQHACSSLLSVML